MTIIALWLCASAVGLAESVHNPIVSTWLDAHKKLETWSADVVQTRHLAALAQPLVSTGRVWYSRPGLFRWELGNPPETIALRSTNELLLIYPSLKRAERYRLDQARSGPLHEMLTLMEAGFPTDEVALRKRYKISTEQLGQGLCRITLEPRTAAARRLVTRVSLTFQTNAFSLTASEIGFADGSHLENRFTNAVRNPHLPAGLFSTNLPADIKLVEPLKP